jgi:hypothetical protein
VPHFCSVHWNAFQTAVDYLCNKRTCHFRNQLSAHPVCVRKCRYLQHRCGLVCFNWECFTQSNNFPRLFSLSHCLSCNLNVKNCYLYLFKTAESAVSQINSVKVRALGLCAWRYAVLCEQVTVHCVQCQPVNCVV